LIGCASGVTLRAPLSAEAAAAPSLSIEVCLNDACLSGTLPRPPSGPENGAVTFPDPQTIEATASPRVDVVVMDDPGPVELHLHYWARGANLRDGDRFSVVCRNPAGATVFSRHRTVTYDESYPNGRECDVVPCRAARIE
jgi:hypothetical protein